jgi:hypothetical protein
MLHSPRFLSIVISSCLLLFLLFRHPLDSSSASGRPPRPPPPPWTQCSDLGTRVDPDSCPSCGSNTNTINTFPIDGLHPGGCWNSDNMRLVPGELVPDSRNTPVDGLQLCPDMKLSLDVADGVFVGRDDDGSIRCDGAALVGATFQVEAAVKVNGTWRSRFARIRLSQARTVLGDSRAGAPAIEHRSYMLSPEDDPSASLCEIAVSAPWREGWLSGAPQAAPRMASPVVVSSATLAQVPAAHVADHALLVAGDVFDEKARRIHQTGPDSGWFNIACAGDGLAKMRLYNLEPPTYSVERREAALKMLTARYCEGKSYTVRGPAIEWKDYSEAEPAERRGSLEARWGAHGALCMSHSRLWRSNTVIPVLSTWKKVCRDDDDNPVACPEERFVADVRDRCHPSIPTCGDVRPAETLWTTYVLDE